MQLSHNRRNTFSTCETKIKVGFYDTTAPFSVFLWMGSSSTFHPIFSHISANLHTGKEATFGPLTEMNSRFLDFKRKIGTVSKYLKMTLLCKMFHGIMDGEF